MNNADLILKNAFTDAFFEELPKTEYKPSAEFEEKMQSLIKSQKGMLRLVNTLGKRVACLLIAALVSLTAVACSVEQIREPILDEIERFFVNAKEYLSGTTADRVAHHFPQAVTKIVATDYISEPDKEYLIENEERIESFLELIGETYFRAPEKYESTDGDYYYWTFDFYNGEALQMQLKMRDEGQGNCRISILQNGEENNYFITEVMYREILSFTDRKLYLHDSVLPSPTKELCIAKRAAALEGLTEEQKKEVKSSIRHAHYSIEALLLENVTLLKDKDSAYWRHFISGEEYTDPISLKTDKFSCFDDYESGVYEAVIRDVERVIEITEDNETAESLRAVVTFWKQSAKSRSLEGLFLVHEYIHDFDYFSFNYPSRYVYSDRVDYQGVYDYFGHLPK